MALSTAPRTASATSRDAATLLAALLTSGRTHEVEPALMSVRKRLREIVAQLGIDPSPVVSAPAPVAPVRPAPVTTRTTVARTARTTTADPDVDPATALADILGRKPTSNMVSRKMRAQNGAKFAYNANLISLVEAEAIYAKAHKDADGAMSDLLLLVSTTPQPAPLAPARTTRKPAGEFVAVFDGTPVATPAHRAFVAQQQVVDTKRGVAVAQELLDLA